MMSEKIRDERELLRKEKEYLAQLKGRQSPDDRLVGLALSGGGIRSASFALGALQALMNRDLIEKLDYLSTVSGGGYIGSCLSWFLNKIYSSKEEQALDSLGKKGRGARSAAKNDVLAYLRQHGKYLIPGYGIDAVSHLAVVLRSIFLGFFVYFPPLVLIFWLFRMAGTTEAGGVISAAIADWHLLNLPIALFVFLVLCMALAALVYSFSTFFASGDRSKTYRLQIFGQRSTGLMLKISIGLLLLGSLPLVLPGVEAVWAMLAAGGLTFLGVIGGVFQLAKNRKPKAGEETKLAGLIPSIAAFLLVYGLLIGGYELAGILGAKWWFIVPVISLFGGFFVNLNYVSMHRVYRDRLMEMFLPDLATVETGRWNLAKEANHKKLHEFKIGRVELARKKFAGPFHIINANMIQIDAEEAKYRGRGGDNFIMTPLFCGSNATGWCGTQDFNGGAMTLASAMAISGAAVNPHAGVAGCGATRTALVSFLMAFLNFRLGYWARNPAKVTGRKKRLPNYARPGLLQGLFGLGFDENADFIELSDGGHFENLAIYELIRRRVGTIIVTDAGADPDFNFSDLANGVEKVRVDFGVDIDFSDSPKPISNLLPGSGEEVSLYRDKYNLARCGYASGVIKYPYKNDKEPAFTGKIYYLKSTLTGGLPEDIYGYRSANPSFPDQSTADQFFDEAQFEAYRELGYQLTKKMLSENPDIV